MFRESSESLCNLFLLVLSEQRILGQFIRTDSEQVNLVPKFGP